MSFTSGSKLGPYEIQSLIGAGGMGEDYRARDTRLHRVVAIKILPESLSSNPDRLARFQQEARILGALNHPNLMAIYDVGSQAGRSAFSRLRVSRRPDTSRTAASWFSPAATGE